MTSHAKPTEAGPVLHVPVPHESAHLHVSGEATYTDDVAELSGTLHAALGLSSKAHAKVTRLDLEPVRAAPGVVGVFTAKDLPGRNDCGPVVQDDPILADGLVQFVGQPLFVVVATSHLLARKAARLAIVEYQDLPAVLTVQDAFEKGLAVIPPMRMVRGDAASALAKAPHLLEGEFVNGGQEHFYLEGQVATAALEENGGVWVHCSTQHPTEMQHHVAHALNVPSNQVHVECRRMGGGFGGKESQSGLFACVAALCAWKLKAPVKLRADRDDDFLITGKRHDFWTTFKLGYDESGRVLGAEATLVSKAGFSADLSGPVMSRALCHFDSGYALNDVRLTGFCAKTNTQSNTAFRGFGGPQGALAMEVAIDTIARRLGVDALDVRYRNLYGDQTGRFTPYGQEVPGDVLPRLLRQLEERSGYRARRAAIVTFNQGSAYLKKGLALTPVKFGISFNATHFNQAGALVHVYTDGSVLVNHGGTEMGQGLFTKVAQVVAHELGVPLAWVRSTATDTSKVANTSATAASSGSDLNGKAAQAAARAVRDRLVEFLAKREGVGAEVIRFEGGLVHVGPKALPFREVVGAAYHARVQLWSDGYYATPKIHWNRETLQGRPFFYFAYGAAVSEVLIDTLTGETRLLRADLLHEAGRSLNPAIDLGQIEGAFVQGVGWLTSEELVWNSASGKLLTHSPSTYKIPTANDCPLELNVALFDDANPEDTIHRSKAVGEPPFLLAFSAFLAIRDAVAATGPARCAPKLDAPATPEAVLRALAALRLMPR